MNPDDLTRIHRAAFAPQRGWSATEFESFLGQANVQLFTHLLGFALVRTIADETELLTIAVDPSAQRKGIGSRLVKNWLDATPAQRAFLEVAADNAPAQSLYAQYGFAVCGRREGYYARQNAEPVDALLMQVALRSRSAPDSLDETPKTG